MQLLDNRRSFWHGLVRQKCSNPLDRSMSNQRDSKSDDRSGESPAASGLWASYASSVFCAQTPDGEIKIRVGTIEQTLERLLREVGANDWAFITAYNPASVQCSAEENAERQQQLERWVIEAGYQYFPGFGAGPDGDWPAEPSLLVLGINRTDAVRLGHRFGQNAIVWGSVGMPAELLDCRSAGRDG